MEIYYYALCQRFWSRMRRRKVRILTLAVCGSLFVTLMILVINLFSGSAPLPTYCEPIDVVYTWVNGSDPYFRAAFLKWSGADNFDPARFSDKNELKYSLRSLEQYAPWVRHIYIVTNQIPNWLDLNYEKVSIVPHDYLTPNIDLLPTFSSSAIETFLHRIPSLSKRFLYINDDIFLGAPLYPEDLYTESEGVQIYQAWMVPDCAEDCPWTYIGDGACDQHCNIAECQFDGGDCAATVDNNARIPGTEEVANNEIEVKSKNATPIMVRGFPLRKQFRKYKRSFRELMKQKNFTNYADLHEIVDAFNKQLKSKEKHTTISTFLRLKGDAVHKSTKDIYSESLIYTNMLLNRHYGFKPRNVIAHVGFLLDRHIIDAMQTKFADEVLKTASHRFRASNDLQFAFAYYSFIMSEQKSLSIEEIFDEFDTDVSGTWSDREVRTFLTRMFPVVDWPAMHFFEEVIGNCSQNMLTEDGETLKSIIHSTLVYERYKDSTLPTITRILVSKCSLLAEAMIINLATRPKYKFKINPKRNAHSNFMMLTSNISQVTYELDRIRRYPRKFNCINDDMNPAETEDNILVTNLLEDFYMSFFPKRSKFELAPNFRNRFTSWQDYQRWLHQKRAALAIGYFLTILLIAFLLRFLCLQKAKPVRHFVHRVFRT